MASTIGHAAAAVAVCSALRPASGVPARYWWLAALAGVLPDVDVAGPLIGGPTLAALGGHRAFTHSFVFAALLAAALTALTVWRTSARPPREWPFRRRVWLAFALATASHAALDSLTKYGEGVAVLAPFDWTRLTAPWHPLGSPVLARGRGPAARALFLVANEALWVWAPAFGLGAGAALVRQSRANVR
jgi:membrane-bound metal-dependent hydrolase YbcI (DUF457 family)